MGAYMKFLLYLASALCLVGAILIGAVVEGVLPFYWGVLAQPKTDIMQAEVIGALLASVMFALAARRATAGRGR